MSVLFVLIQGAAQICASGAHAAALEQYVAPHGAADVAAVFAERNETRTVMQVEAALARAQAAAGVIPAQAAQEISATADPAYAPADELAQARRRVGHRMVALLEVWRARLSPQAANYLHYGATTVDIYDTALTLQLLEALASISAAREGLQERLRELALRYRATPMVGRTLGQHALPITFGKKVSVWIGELDRHGERLCELRARLRRSAILKGPVGSYAGLGPHGAEVERRFAAQLGLDAPYADDWHGSRDVFAEAALNLALLSASLGRLGQEVFLLQMTDIGEVSETLPPSVVGSSSMPHKVNPSKSGALMHAARAIPAAAGVLLADVINFFERDNTSRPNSALAELVERSAQALSTARALIDSLAVHPQSMLANLQRTGGLIRSPQVVVRLAAHMDKARAEKIVRRAARKAHEGEAEFIGALLQEQPVRRFMSEAELRELLDPLSDLDGAAQQVDAVVAASARTREGSCGSH